MVFTPEEQAQVDAAVAAGKVRRVENADFLPFKPQRGRPRRQFDRDAYLLRHRFLEERGLDIFTSPLTEVLTAFNEGGILTVSGRPVTKLNIDAIRTGIRRALAA